MAPAHSAKPLGKWTVPSSRDIERGRRCTFLARSGVHSLLSIDSERVGCVGCSTYCSTRRRHWHASGYFFFLWSGELGSGWNVLRPPVAQSSKRTGAVFDPHGESSPFAARWKLKRVHVGT